MNFSTTGMMLLADLAGQDGHLDEFVVLEAVADDRRVRSVGEGQHGEQFGLGAGLQAEVERLAEIEDLLDDVPLLVHLDRIDAAVFALVLELLDGGAGRPRGSRRRDGGGCR